MTWRRRKFEVNDYNLSKIGERHNSIGRVKQTKPILWSCWGPFNVETLKLDTWSLKPERELRQNLVWRLEIVVVFGGAGGAKHNYTATYRKESKRSSSPRPWNGPSLAPVGHRRTEANSATRPTYGQLVSRRKMNDETWVWRQPRDRNQDSLHFFVRVQLLQIRMTDALIDKFILTRWSVAISNSLPRRECAYIQSTVFFGSW